MLVFDNQETFDATLKMLDNMNADERKTWEENLGFKSYDRLMHEIIDAQITLDNQYENLSVEEQQKLLKNANIEQYSPIVKEYQEKGVVYFTKNQEGYESMNFVHLPFPKLINENGFYKVGKRIMQYTNTKFKVIESGDFEKMDDLQQINENLENNEFFISDLIINRNKLIDPIDPPDDDGDYLPPPISYYTFPEWNEVAYVSSEIDDQKIVLIEQWIQHGYNTDDFITIYNVVVKAEKKNIWGNWVVEETRIWFDGWCQVLDGETSPYVTYDINDVYDDVISQCPYYAIWLKGTYPNYHFMPYVPSSYWKATRWGGSSGIWVSVKDHLEAHSNYY